MNLDEEPDDEDFDVSNQAFDKHLTEIEADIEGPTNENAATLETKESALTDEDFKKRCNNESLRRDSILLNLFSFFKPASLIDHRKSINFILSHERIINQIMINEDKKFIFDAQLDNIGPTSSKSKLNDVRFFVLILAIAACYLYSGSVYLVIFIILIASLVALTRLDSIDLVLLHLAKVMLLYFQKTNSLIHYLKEVELASLSVSRQYIIEHKLKDEPMLDELNLKFRRQVLLNLLDDYDSLKVLNRKCLDGMNLSESFRSTLICTMNKSDLSPILQVKRSSIEELNTLTDSFSPNCSKSLNKLNKLLVSEYFKIIFYRFIHQARVEKGFCGQLCSLIELNLRLVKSWLLVRKMHARIEQIFDICKLANESSLPDELPISARTSTEITSHSLAISLRHALLTVYELNKLPSRNFEQLSELFGSLKISMSYCDVYFRQLSCEMNTDTNQADTTNSSEKIEIPLEQSQLNVAKESPTPVIVLDDEIFEADTFNLVPERTAPGDINVEVSLAEQRNNMMSKNLMYELKYALKSKKSEWRMREKRVLMKRGGVNEEIGNGSDDEPLEDADHLLDNDAAKYKSKLCLRRRSVRDKVATKMGPKSSSKYRLEESDENMDRDDKRADASHAAFLNQILNRRNDFLGKFAANSEENEDEIVYSD